MCGRDNSAKLYNRLCRRPIPPPPRFSPLHLLPPFEARRKNRNWGGSYLLACALQSLVNAASRICEPGTSQSGASTVPPARRLSKEEGLREKQPYGITPSFQITGIEGGWERCNVDSGERKILLSPHCRLFYTLSSGDGYTWIILSPPHCLSYLLPTITFFILADHKSGQSIKLLSLFFFSTYILRHTLYHNPSQLLQRAICALAGQARPEAQPTLQLGSVQLVITESSSSETSREDGTPLWNSLLLYMVYFWPETSYQVKMATLFDSQCLFKEIFTRSQRATWHLFCRRQRYYKLILSLVGPITTHQFVNHGFILADSHF